MTVIMVCIALVIRSAHPPFAFVFSVCCTVWLAFMYAQSISPLIEYLTELSERAGADEYLHYILRSTGVCILGSLSSELCRETGNTAMAQALHAVCKIAILLICLPLIKSVLDAALSLV